MSTSEYSQLVCANAAAAATPAVRGLANQLGVALADVTGTGAGGRITVEDVRAAASDDSWFPGAMTPTAS